MEGRSEGSLWAHLLGLLKTLADPVRFTILIDLLNEPKTYQDLMDLTHKTKSQISKHIKLLHQFNLVQKSQQDLQLLVSITSKANNLLQIFRGVLLNTPGTPHDQDTYAHKEGVMIPIETVHELLRARTRLIDLLLLTSQIDEQTYWKIMLDVFQLAKQYGLDLDLSQIPHIMLNSP